MARDQAADLRRAGLLAAGIGLAVGGLALVYPWVLDALLVRVGERGLALALLGVLALSLPVRARLLGGDGPAFWLPSAGLAALLALAAVNGDAAALRAVPAWVYLCLAGFFAASLREPDSIVERGARWIVPVAPDFIRSYCRKTTAMWAGVFVGIAAVTAWLALEDDPAAWRRFTSVTVWIVMGGLAAAEFLFRKTWFRHYARGGPFERFWSRLFPAERTERGRRSLDYIRRTKSEQGLSGDDPGAPAQMP
jgi:uncharacterized membrane protein